MSANGTIVRVWSHGEDTFCLAKIGHILDLEERCGCGVAAIMSRLEAGMWGIRDVREPIRIGLIGGTNMDPKKAQDIVDRHVVPPFRECVLLAYGIIEAIMVAPEGDQPGKAGADRAAPESPSTSTEGSIDSPSTGSEPDLAGAPA